MSTLELELSSQICVRISCSNKILPGRITGLKWHLEKPLCCSCYLGLVLSSQRLLQLRSHSLLLRGCKTDTLVNDDWPAWGDGGPLVYIVCY